MGFQHNNRFEEWLEQRLGEDSLDGRFADYISHFLRVHEGLLCSDSAQASSTLEEYLVTVYRRILISPRTHPNHAVDFGKLATAIIREWKHEGQEAIPFSTWAVDQLERLGIVDEGIFGDYLEGSLRSIEYPLPITKNLDVSESPFADLVEMLVSGVSLEERSQKKTEQIHDFLLAAHQFVHSGGFKSENADRRGYPLFSCSSLTSTVSTSSVYTAHTSQDLSDITPYDPQCTLFSSPMTRYGANTPPPSLASSTSFHPLPEPAFLHSFSSLTLSSMPSSSDSTCLSPVQSHPPLTISETTDMYRVTSPGADRMMPRTTLITPLAPAPSQQ